MKRVTSGAHGWPYYKHCFCPIEKERGSSPRGQISFQAFLFRLLEKRSARHSKKTDNGSSLKIFARFALCGRSASKYMYFARITSRSLCRFCKVKLTEFTVPSLGENYPKKGYAFPYRQSFVFHSFDQK